MDNPLRLDDLPLDALNDMATMIVGLKEAGYVMREQGLEPCFDLRPGFPVRMTLAYRVPMPAPIVSGIDWGTGPDVTVVTEMSNGAMKTAELRKGFLDEFTPRPALEVKTEAEDLTLQGAELSLDPAPLTAADIDAAVSGAFIAVTGRDPVPVPTYDDDAGADLAPAVPAPAAPAPAAPAPTVQPAPWTEEEDRKLVLIVSERMVLLGHSKNAASDFAAVRLGRPSPGTYFRLKNKLAERLAAAVAALQADRSEPAAPLTPKAAPADSGGGADPSPAAPIAAPSTPANTLTAATLSPIEQHLLDMPTKGGWTLELDRELLQLAEDGWKMADIALDMGRDARAVQDRFDLLTGWDRDAKTRKYTRFALLNAAKDWCAKTHAAAE